ncbi:hypothetical protein AB0O34_34725 [Sphaerisporangium sp. NPDC088356]
MQGTPSDTITVKKSTLILGGIGLLIVAFVVFLIVASRTSDSAAAPSAT